MIRSVLFHIRKYLKLLAMCYFHKRAAKQEIVYWCHILAGASQSSFSSLWMLAKYPLSCIDPECIQAPKWLQPWPRNLYQGWVSLWKRRKKEDPELSDMCFNEALTYHICLCSLSLSGRRDGNLKRLLISSLSFRICGVHHKEWLVHNKINDEGKYCRDFSVAYELTQIIEEPNPYPGRDGTSAEPAPPISNLLHW